MNKLQILTLKILRKLYSKCFDSLQNAKPQCILDPDKASEIIYQALISDEPYMIARFGGFELSTLTNYLGVKKGKGSFYKYITGNELDWWWNQSLLDSMYTNAGFFPAREDKIEQFCELMLSDIKEVDALGSWLPNERLFKKELDNSIKIRLELLNPYFSNTPWTKALQGKKVLVVHPFANSIEKQYKKRKLLFKNDLLPDFQLQTIKAVQTIAGTKTDFSTWFDALEYMKKQIDLKDFDVCLIGCGAYGFPLAAHVKRTGKKAIHLGGSLQLLFGIRGSRWENPNYNPNYNYVALMNEHWVKPSAEETPKAFKKVENGTYW